MYKKGDSYEAAKKIAMAMPIPGVHIVLVTAAAIWWEVKAFSRPERRDGNLRFDIISPRYQFLVHRKSFICRSTDNPADFHAAANSPNRISKKFENEATVDKFTEWLPTARLKSVVPTSTAVVSVKFLFFFLCSRES